MCGREATERKRTSQLFPAEKGLDLFFGERTRPRAEVGDSPASLDGRLGEPSPPIFGAPDFYTCCVFGISSTGGGEGP